MSVFNSRCSYGYLEETIFLLFYIGVYHIDYLPIRYVYIFDTYIPRYVFYYCTFTFTLLWVSRYLIRLSDWHLLHLIASSPALNICSNFILMFTHLKYTYKYSYGYEMVCSNIPYLFHNIESCNKGADTEHLIRLM